MFGKELLRRLEAVEDHIAKYDEKASKSLVIETELSAQLKDITEQFANFERKEENFMRERARAEKESAKENMQVLGSIKDDIQSIKTDLKSQPKDMALQLLQQKEQTKEYVSENYATKDELNEGLSSIRRHAKLIWTTILSIAALVAWAIEKTIKLIGN